MNLAEIKFLCSKDLSHAARSLYLLYLRVAAEKGEVFADPLEISSFLANESSVQSTPSDLKFCHSILNELQDHGLIEYKEPDEAPFCNLALPLFEAELDSIPKAPFKMTSDWRPGPGFVVAARLTGLSDTDFTEDELQSFISYWREKPELRNQISWERSFCQRLLKKRTAAKARSRSRTKKLKAQSPVIKARESRF